MFVAEDYRKLLSIGREYSILLDVQDSLIVKHKELDIEVMAYILQVNNFQEIADSMGVEIVDLRRNFNDYSEKTEKRIAKLYRANKRWRTIAIAAVAVAIGEAIMIISIAR